MRNRLISTVGTSLLSNIRNLRDRELEKYCALRECVEMSNWGQLTNELLKLDPFERVCGAEINSVADAVKRGKLSSLQFVDFLVSDTADGKIMGKLLEDYFTERGIRGWYDLQNARYHVIEELQDEDPARFKVYGLRNLVRKLGELVRSGDYFNAEDFVIDATGGYKAQIAIAVVFGQALGIPVLYRHERFSEIIDFPPMPVTFDYNLIGQNADLLAAFERGKALDTTEIGDVDERIRILLEEIEVEGERIYELGAVGQIFLTGFRLRLPKDQTLSNVPVDAKSSPRFRDDNYPIGFKNFVEKLCQEVGWVKTAHSLPYDKQKAISGIGFYTREQKIIGTYQDKNRFGARFELLTDAESDAQRTWAVDYLNQLYGAG